ncbi:MAG: thiamine pyrophosphate-dependent enzyme [Candidatus Hadarchaeales archaeon]
MTMGRIGMDQPGRRMLLSGNEAIARGALEAGVQVCSGYPGNPASEVVEALLEVSRDFDLYVEWSTNEMVALEVAGAVAATGLRSLTAMKNLGVDVCSDFLMTVNLSGTKGGFVLVTGDDPAAHSTTTELDTRNYARMADVPLLEPSTPQEAKEMTKWAFELSEELGLICMVRSVTRLSHSRGVVELGVLSRERRKPEFTAPPPWTSGSSTFACMFHDMLHQKMKTASEKFETSPFNKYEGPEHPNLLLITSGPSYTYSAEAVELLGLQDSVGILKLGTTWPLPEELLFKHLRLAQEVLFVEEIDPFLEQNVKMLAAEFASRGLKPPKFYGKKSGHLPAVGELNTELVLRALSGLTGVSYSPRPSEYASRAEELVGGYVPGRSMAFCPGCPHRASFWVMKRALKWEGREAVVTGDIGCYSMGLLPTGFSVEQTLHCMGAGIGTACGFGKLERFGFDKPVVSVSGDSTFYHACIPALINAKWNSSNLLHVVLDNSTTGMTGHQPHPGSGITASGEPSPPIRVEELCKGIGVEVRVCDPFEVDEATKTFYEMLKERGPRVLVFRHPCPLTESEKKKRKPRVYVDQEKCIGEECGCMAFCSRVLGCPANIWDYSKGKAKIDEVLCTGCGLCAKLCPAGAIVVEEEK